MKICKVELTKKRTQLIKMPEKSEIMDIQMQDGKFVMWFLTNLESKEIEVKINIYETGCETHDNALKDEYLSTVQYGGLAWHFFMNYDNS